MLAGLASLVVCTMSSGLTALLASRLLRTIVSALVSATLRAPLPATSGVTSTETGPAAAKAPLEPVTVCEEDGALLYVIVVSPQVVLGTARTAYPAVEALEACKRNVAFTTVPLSPCTLKRR